MDRVARRAVLGGMAGTLLASSARAGGATVGNPAPPFTVTMYDRQKLSLADLAGQVVVLNYWATWCAPCRAELPMMDAYARVRASAGLAIFAVDTEDDVPDAKLKPLAMQLHFPLVTRFSGRGYGMINGAVPTNYVIDRAGVVRYAAAGAFELQSFDALLRPLLLEPAPKALGAAPTAS